MKRTVIVLMLVLAACSEKEPSRPQMAPATAEQIPGHSTLWRTPDGTVYGPCADVRPYIATITPEPGFVCS